MTCQAFPKFAMLGLPIMNWSKRLTEAREARAMNKTAFARAVGVSQPTVTDWENGVMRPKGDNLLKIGRVLGVSPDWLMRGIKSRAGTEPGPDIRGKVPLISWVQAGQWSEISDQFPPGDAEGWRETTARVGAGAFALRIMGDSMEPTIPRGSVVVVDPSAEATNGRVVVVRQNGDNEATIKRLVIDGGVRYLKPDNPRYPIMEMRTDAVICGVAIKVEQDL